MKIGLNILGVLVILIGTVWGMQGLGIMPDSLMSGQLQWAFFGGIAIIVGGGILFFTNRRKATRPKNKAKLKP